MYPAPFLVRLQILLVIHEYAIQIADEIIALLEETL